MSNYPYDLNLLWDCTNFGLDFWHELFPDSIGKENKKKHFKTHDENTASTTLSNKLGTDNVYVIYNHASSEKYNPIQWIMKERNFSFVEALAFLFEKYNLSKSNNHSFKPTTTYTDTNKEVGTWNISFKEKHWDYKTIFPFGTDEILAEYHFKSVDSYSKVVLSSKTNKPTEILVVANENYPIFAYDNGEFYKIYEPCAAKDDKYSLKHHFLGKKPDRFIYGWNQIFDSVNIDVIDSILSRIKGSEGAKRKAIVKELEEEQLEAIFICTGGSDAINVASLGHRVIWFNSESEIPNKTEIYQLSKAAKVIYYIPDLDTTGVEQGVKLGLQHINVKLVWLPDTLKQENKKDIADWTRRNKSLPQSQVTSMFRQLISLALPFQFWNFDVEKNRYSMNNKIMLYFLKHNGFLVQKIKYRTADGLDEERTRLVQLKNNIASIVTPRQVKNYVLKWLDDNYISIEVYNMILKSVYFSDAHLLSLAEIILDTDNATATSQHYFFKNKAVKVTATEIKLEDFKAIKKTIWENNIIDHYLEIEKPFFEYSIDDNQNKRIKILNNNSNYLKVLINTSRLYWEKDANETGHDTNPFEINSKKLTEEENAMQELQLLNKIYVVGYLLSKYKEKQKAYLTLGLDYINPKSIKDSNGRSGKSFIQEALKCFLHNWKQKDGKNLPKENPQFIFDKVTENTDFIFFDDIHQYQDYNFFFSKTTSNIEANHKGGDIYDIPFDAAPKIGLTSNFAPTNLSASLQGRLLVYYVSDYYHQKTDDNEYLFTRQISDDFNGRQILSRGCSVKEWNADYNFMLQCLQFYLSQPQKIEAPLDTIVTKSLRMKIGDDLYSLYQDFFSDETKLENWVLKKEIIDAYKQDVGGKRTAQQQKEALINFCKILGWSIEFKKLPHIDEITSKRNVLEHFYISKNKINIEDLETEIEPGLPFVELDEPF